ncbi:MAG: hypothetical protein C0175_05375 [Caldisericum exile]|uniref:Calcineurin-like phosphoesterase domain-containing protein n=1 Tax=Caldisericum exile TaxID=693075 RepID=A0A2J6X4S6_9BACT|nr:MAG: hypothetical protein C0175_05375 [Caldisericum exile]
MDKRVFFIFLIFLISFVIFIFGTETFRFIVFGDNRPYNNEEPQPAVFRQIVQDAEWIHPSFVIDTGDLVHGYDANAEQTWKQYIDFLNVTKIFDMPFYTTVGNHDVAGENGQTDYELLLHRPLYYSFNYDTSHFIVLDTNVNSPNGNFTQAQYDWLVKDLESATSADNIFIFMHKPLHEYGDPTDTAWTDKAMAQKVEELFNSYNQKYHNIRIVFEGHEHLYWKADFDGITYIITGGAGAPLYQAPQDGGFYHFVLVTVYGKQVYTQVFLPGYFDVKYYPLNTGAFNNVTAIIKNHLPTIYDGLIIKGLQFVMPDSSSYTVSGNIPSRIWKTVKNDNGTVTVYVEAKLELGSYSQMTQNVVTVSVAK